MSKRINEINMIRTIDAHPAQTSEPPTDNEQTDNERADNRQNNDRQNAHQRADELQGQIRIWPELQSLLRPLKVDEMNRLVSSLDANGQISPILVMRDGRIIDGAQRFKILGAAVNYSVWDIDEEKAIDIGIGLNVTGRQMSTDDIASLAQQLKRNPKRHELAAFLLSKGMLQKEVAVRLGVTARTVRRWKPIGQEDFTEQHAASNPKSICATSTKTTSVEIEEESAPKNPAMESEHPSLFSTPEPIVRFYAPIVTDIAREISAREISAREREARDETATGSEARVDPAQPIVFPDRYRSHFRTLVIDPPWPIQKLHRPNQAVNGQMRSNLDYATMSLQQIAAMPIPSLYHPEGCDVFLWSVDRFESEILEILQGWGIKSVRRLAWHKSRGMNIPHKYITNNCEYMFWGQIGRPKRRDTRGLQSCFYGERLEHSRKPVASYDMIGRCFQGPRLDIFSREKHPDFLQWGNQTDHFDAENVIILPMMTYYLKQSGRFDEDVLQRMSKSRLVSGRYFDTKEKREAYFLACRMMRRAGFLNFRRGFHKSKDRQLIRKVNDFLEQSL